MATTRPPGGGPQARIGIDLSSMQAAASVARAAGQATAREINAMFQAVRASQRLAIDESRQVTSRITADSQVRIQQARAESIAQQQAARASAQTVIQEEKRKTAAFNAEIRARQQAQRQSQAFGQGVSQFAGAALGGIGGPAGAVLGGLAGGTPAIAAGLAVATGARAAIEASQVAVAYERQRVGAVNLAGSQAKLNELLATYQRVTGGAINNATALADVTSLMTQNFANSSAQLERFLRGVRGASVATGRPQDFIIERAQFEMLNQTGQRLNEIGLGMEEVRTRAEELRQTNSSLTKEQAYQEAVLDALNAKFGALSDSAVAQATGIEKMRKAWSDLSLETGKGLQVPADNFGEYVANRIKDIQELMKWEQRRWEQGKQIYGVQSIAPSNQDFIDPGKKMYGVQSIAPTIQMGGGLPNQFNDPVISPVRPSVPQSFNDDQVAALRRREEGFADIEKAASEQMIDAAAQYARQRTSIETSYHKSVMREAEDFARQRANAERKLQMSLLDVAQDSARQRVKWEQDTARAIAEAQGETAERIAELRADSAEKVAEIEEDFAKDQEKRARDHGERLRDAAANLDAVAVREEQRRFREENKEAKEAHEEQISDAQKSLQKAIDDQNKALAKQEQQQRESLQRRIDEQAENDRLRIEEMKAAFEEQKAQEDIERGIRLERQAEDHNEQLIELDRQHGERIQQIKDQAQEERDQWTEESNAFLEDVHIHNQAWLDEQEAINDGVIKRHEELLEAERRALLNAMGQTPGFPSLANPYQYVPPVPSTSASSINNSRTVHGGVNLTLVAPASFAADAQSSAWLHGELKKFFDGLSS